MGFFAVLMENNAYVSSIVGQEEPLSKQVYSSPPKEAQSTNETAPRNVHKAKVLARKLPSTLIGVQNNRTNPSIVIEKQPLLSTTMGSSPLPSSKRLL